MTPRIVVTSGDPAHSLCRDCGDHHPTGGSGIVCDWLRGLPTPGITSRQQETIARELLAWVAILSERGET